MGRVAQVKGWGQVTMFTLQTTISLWPDDIEILNQMLEQRAEELEITAVYLLEGGDDDDEEFVTYACALPFGFHDYMDGVVADVENGRQAMEWAMRLRAIQASMRAATH